MLSFIVNNLNEVTSIESYNTLEDATNVFEEYPEIPGENIYVLKIATGKTFGVNETGSFGGEEIFTNH